MTTIVCHWPIGDGTAVYREFGSARDADAFMHGLVMQGRTDRAVKAELTQCFERVIPAPQIANTPVPTMPKCACGRYIRTRSTKKLSLPTQCPSCAAIKREKMKAAAPQIIAEAAQADFAQSDNGREPAAVSGAPMGSSGVAV